MQKYRFGIVGTGMIANKFAEAAQILSDRMILQAVASRTLEKAQAFANNYQIPDTYESYEAMALADDIDVVYIATPHNFHLANIELFAAHKKHILCEKPIVVNAREAAQLLELSEKHNVFIMEAYWSVFVPAYLKFQELLSDYQMNESGFLRSEIGFSHPGARGMRKVDPTLAGGALLDVGVYNLMIAGEVFSYEFDIRDVKTIKNDQDIDVFDAFVLDHGSGRTSYNICTVKGRMTNELIVFGQDGCLILKNFLGSQLVVEDKKGLAPVEHHFPFAANGYEFEIRHVCDCLDQGLLQSDKMPLSKSVAIIQSADEIRKRINLKYEYEEFEYESQKK